MISVSSFHGTNCHEIYPFPIPYNYVSTFITYGKNVSKASARVLATDRRKYDSGIADRVDNGNGENVGKSIVTGSVSKALAKVSATWLVNTSPREHFRECWQRCMLDCCRLPLSASMHTIEN